MFLKSLGIPFHYSDNFAFSMTYEISAKKILSDPHQVTFFDIFSDIFSDILSGILSGISSEILCG